MSRISLSEAAAAILGPIAAEYGEIGNISSDTYPVPVAALKKLERAHHQEFDRRERAADNKAKRDDLFRRASQKQEG